MKIKVRVSEKEMRYIRHMKNYNFDEFLLYRLKALQLGIEETDEELLKKKIEKIKKIIEIMKEEIPKLEEFYKKAEEDKETFERWIDELDEENKSLLEMVKNDRGNH